MTTWNLTHSQSLKISKSQREEELWRLVWRVLTVRAHIFAKINQERRERTKMVGEEARLLLGFPPNSQPNRSQVKAAYKRKVWEFHPDLFPSHQKSQAESKFKQLSEAYTCLLSDGKYEDSASAKYSRVMRTGVPRAHGERRSQALIKIPFFFIVMGTVALGGLNATRAYKREKEAYPSHNPFLP